MPRVHHRKDFEYIILKGKGMVTGRPAYACVITQSTAYPDVRCIYHVETFHYGDGGKAETATQIRARARRYGSAICNGKRGVNTYRNQYIPYGFTPKLDLPRENEVEVR